MPATVLAERVGWTGSIRWFRDNVKRAVEAPRIDPADRLTWAPGDAARVICGSRPARSSSKIGSRALLPVLVMTAAHSRFVDAQMIPTRKSTDLLLGSWELLTRLGRVPRRLIWDNEPGIGRGKLTEQAAVFAGVLATKIVLLRPRDPESKGGGGTRNGFFETSFMPGRHFASPEDFNAQFSDWLITANLTRGAHRCGRGRWTCWPRTKKRCWRYRRRWRTWGGAIRSDWAATTTYAWTPTTTPWTPAPSAPASRSPRIWTL